MHAASCYDHHIPEDQRDELMQRNLLDIQYSLGFLLVDYHSPQCLHWFIRARDTMLNITPTSTNDILLAGHIHFYLALNCTTLAEEDNYLNSALNFYRYVYTTIPNENHAEKLAFCELAMADYCDKINEENTACLWRVSAKLNQHNARQQSQNPATLLGKNAPTTPEQEVALANRTGNLRVSI